MRRLLTAIGLVAVFASLALAESFSGRLIDASCTEKQKAEACQPTSTTTSFAIDVSGKVYKLDSTGNAKAAEALKSRADRAANPDSTAAAAAVMAKISGTKEGETIKVEALEVQ